MNICFLDNFQDQMKRELSYREEMVQQLHIVRGETHKAEETLDSNTNVFAKLMLCVLKHELQFFKKTIKTGFIPYFLLLFRPNRLKHMFLNS